MATPVLVVPTTNNAVTGVIAQPTLINALAIRDTSAHDCTTDTPGTNTFLADVRAIPGSRLLYVVNGLDQAVTITLEGSGDGVAVQAQGSGVSIDSATTAWIDASSISQLSNPYPYVSVEAQCGMSPTSGTLTVELIVSSIGGDVSNVGSISLGSTTITGALPAGTNTIGNVNLTAGSIPGQNTDNVTVITSAAQTTDVNSSDKTNTNCNGVNVYVNTGSFGVGATLVVATIQGKDPVSGTYYTILASAGLTASTFYVLQVYPGIVGATNTAANAALPKTWRVALTASAWGTGGSTVGVSAGLIV